MAKRKTETQEKVAENNEITETKILEIQDKNEEIQKQEKVKKTEIKTHFNVKNKITGYTYKLPKEDVDRLVIDEPHNFEVIDEDYIKPVIEIADKTVYSQIVEDKN